MKPATWPVPAAPVRLRLDPVMTRRGALDGGWWPYSRDAATELPLLVTALTGLGFGIRRLTVDSGDWDHVPHRTLAVGEQTVRLGKMPDIDHQIIVTCHGEDLMLLTVPPDIQPEAGQQALHAAATGLASRRPHDILSDCTHTADDPHRR